jgi:serpin B
VDRTCLDPGIATESIAVSAQRIVRRTNDSKVERPPRPPSPCSEFAGGPHAPPACATGSHATLGISEAMSCTAFGLGTAILAVAGAEHDSIRVVLDPGEARFATSLQRCIGGPTDNLFWSPFSVRVAFALVYAGARDRTQDELYDALALTLPPEQVHQRFAVCLRDLARRATPSAIPGMPPEHAEQKRLVLRIATRLWATPGAPLLDSFMAQAADVYRVSVERLDLSGDPEGASDRINGWVNEATEGKITELVSPRAIRAASLVLTNAAYFRASWTTPFWDALTQNAPFHTPHGTVDVPLMEQTEHLNYAELHETHLVDVPYGSGQLVMRLAIPRQVQGLAIAENHADVLLSAPLDTSRVHLQLPRFRLESELELVEALSSLGMRALFHYPDADLSGIDGTRELFVSSVVHRAFVKVDEKGTEAAAATAAVAVAGGMFRPEPLIEVRADRPFLFWIIDQPTGTVLFAGRLVDPSAK